MRKRISLDSKNPWSYLVDDPIRTEEGLVVELGDWRGRGGNSAVYSCIDASSGEELAIKFLLVNGKKLHQRFEREVVLLRELNNLHIVRFRGSGTVKAEANAKGRKAYIKIPFIVMELAEQNLLEVMTKRRRGFPYEDYAGQFRGLSGALAELHTKAIHRDIKPENILVIGDRWLLSDYGLCSYVDPELPDLTGENEKVGPKFWLSPEAQNRMLKCSDEITRASDVFQMAAVFWYVATGRHPLGIIAVTDWTGPQKLYGVLHAALMHDSRHRPQNGQELLKAIEDSLQGE